MQRNGCILIFSIILGIGYCIDTPFVHLLGYKLIADVGENITTTDPSYCAKVCSIDLNCTAFQILNEKCYLLKMMRAAVIENDACGYYIRNSSQVIVVNRTVDDIQQLVQNAVYNFQRRCPPGFGKTIKCSNNVIKKQVCEEYDAFLGFWWDEANKLCRAPVMNLTYECPDDTFTPTNYIYSYCHKIVPKGLIDVNDGNVYNTAEDYCKQYANSSLTSIHSSSANIVINQLQQTLPSPNGLMIGLKADSNIVNKINDLYWSDGTAKDYSNFVTGLKFPSKFTITMMTSKGTWTTDQSSLASFEYIACQTWATAYLMEIAPGV
uniref:C-type lectin domain-containing protein n=2 Tax=Panagrellus redivivus TaxID=6233 RepID=A0A7E4UYZ1_PANRE